jgi:hypothetical protein
VIWVLNRDRQHLFVIDRNAGTAPMPFSPANNREIWNVMPADDGSTAWVDFLRATGGSPPPDLALAVRRGAEYRDAPAGPPPELNNADYSYLSAAAGKKVWAFAPDSPGIYLIDEKQVMPIGKESYSRLLTSNSGRLAWVSPRRGKGIFVISADGKFQNSGKAVIPDEEIDAVSGTEKGTILWVKARSETVYVLSARPVGDGWDIKLLNMGKPVSSKENPLFADKVDAVGEEGSRAWLVPRARFEKSKMLSTMWHLILKDGAVRALSIPKDAYDRKLIRVAWWDYHRPDRLWVQTQDLSLYRSDYKIYQDQLLDSGSTIKVADFATAQFWVEDLNAIDVDSNRAWTGNGPLFGLMGLLEPGSKLERAELDFNGAKLTTASEPNDAAAIRFQVEPGSTVTAKVPWANLGKADTRSPSGDGKSRDHTVVEVRFLDPQDHSARPKAEGRAELVDGVAAIALEVHGNVAARQVLDVELHSHNYDSMSDFRALWSGVKFQPTWYTVVLDSPYFKGFVALLAPTLVLLMLMNRTLAARRWIPVVVPLAELLSLQWFPPSLRISPLELITVAFGAVCALLIVGLWSPTLFRELALLQPYRPLVPLALEVPRIRRRIFKEYCDDVKRSIADFRRDASDEIYIDFAVKVIDGTSGATQSAGSKLSIGEVAPVLTATDANERTSLFIVAPGGRGKSALWNELLSRSLEAFQRDPSCPMPVIGDSTSPTIDKMIEVGLGGFSISPEYTGSQLAAGALLLFVDNLSATMITPSDMEAFIRSKQGKWTRFCLATRPAMDFRRALRASTRWMAIEPCKLDDDSVKGFISAYARTDALATLASNERPTPVPGEEKERRIAALMQPVTQRMEQLLPLCRSKDGTFLPLLVRLCTLAAEENITSVDEIYASTLYRLIERTTRDSTRALATVLLAAEQLASRTYWEEQARIFLLERSAAEETVTADDLLRMGILVAADKVSRLSPRPRAVRFLHDSVQSYLTAKALFHSATWDCFYRAAGDPFFSSAETDLGGGPAPELLQMCLQAFAPKSRVRRVLADELRKWAGAYYEVFSVEQIKKGLSPDARAQVERELAESSNGADVYLRRAIELATEEDLAADEAKCVGLLFSALAPIVWKTRAIEAEAMVA